MEHVERVLFVHAHPDDETIDTGGTIATLVDAGAQVTVVTVTRGERGEAIAANLTPAALKSALASRAGMATHRVVELDAAMKVLGVSDHRFLGDSDARWSGTSDRAYVDSGMSWGETTGAGAPVAQPADEHDPASLTAATLEDVTADIASVVIAVAPTAVVSYDEDGGYGHPDHIRVHDAARRAADLYGVPYYAILPAGAAAAPGRAGAVAVDVHPVFDRKKRALSAYASQLTIVGDTMVMPGGQQQPITVVERYQRLAPEPVGAIAFADQHPAVRFFLAVFAGIIGVLFGSFLSVFNQSTATIAGQPIWIGVIVALLVTAVLLAGLRLAFGTRIVAGFAAVALVVIVGVLSQTSIGGSILIAPNGQGYLWIFAPAVIAIIVLAWPQSRRARPGKIANQSILMAPDSSTSDVVAGDVVSGEVASGDVAAATVHRGADEDAPSKGSQQP